MALVRHTNQQSSISQSLPPDHGLYVDVGFLDSGDQYDDSAKEYEALLQDLAILTPEPTLRQLPDLSTATSKSASGLRGDNDCSV